MQDGLIKATKVATGFGLAVSAIGVKSFNDFDEAVRQAAASAGITGEEINKLKEDMKGVYSNNFGDDWADVGDSVAIVNKYLEGTGEDIQKATENALAFRDVFGYEVSESMRATDALMKNFGITSDEAFNLMAQGMQSNLDFSDEFIDSLNEYSVQCKKVGLTAEDMFNMLASGAENGAWKLDTIGNAAKEFAIKAIDGSKTTAEGFQAIGMDADEMAQKFAQGGEGARGAFQEVIKALGEMEDPVKQNMAGVNLFGTMWEDLSAGVVTGLTQIDNAFDASKDTMGEINEIKYTSFMSGLKGLGRQIEGAVLPIGEAVLPALNEFANWLSGVLPAAAKQFSGYISEHIGTAIDFAKSQLNNLKSAFLILKNNMNITIPVISGVATALGSFLIITKIVRMYDNFRKATEGLTLVQAILNKTMLNNPLLWIAVAIGTLVGAFVLAYKNSEKFRNFVNQLWTKLKEFGKGLATNVVAGVKTFYGWFKDKVIPILIKVAGYIPPIWNKFKEFASSIVSVVVPALQSMWSWFQEKIMPILSSIAQNMQYLWNQVLVPGIQIAIEKLGELWNFMQPFVSFLKDVFGAAFSGAFEYIKGTITTAIGTIKGLIEGLLEIFNGVITFVNGVFTGNWEMAWEGIKGIFSGIVDGIKSIFKGVINSIINILNGFIKGANGMIGILGKIPGFSWAQDVQIPTIPQFATGTEYAPGGIALVGEYGPELVSLPKGSKVTTASKTQDILNKKNQQIQININVQGNLIGNRQMAEEMGNIIAKKILTACANI